jgi:signal transduction histidine kinase
MPIVDTDDPGISLLYVEDEADAQEMLSEIIRFSYPGITLFLAENGKTGFDAFKKHRPEIVITDINMPVENGIKMASRIKELCPSTEIIALTAHTDTQYLLQAIEIGINKYVLKPIDVGHILEVIDKTVAIIRAERLIAQQNAAIRHLNTELARKTDALELANKELESYDYSVAHDLRSPLVTIRGFSKILLEKHDSRLDDAGKRCLQVIDKEITRIDNFVGSLLEMSVHSRKHVNKSKTNLSDIVCDISRYLQENEPDRQVTFSIAEGVNGYCDPDLMRFVLENLLRNAWKYSLSTEAVRIEFGTINEEHDQIYFVRDNGSGFDESESEKIFAPFQRLQSDGTIEGFGVGLATARRIILRHGGKIWAEGEKGKGATFYFTL